MRQLEYSPGGASQLLTNPLDVYRAMKRRDIERASPLIDGRVVGMPGQMIDLEWLPFAAKEYRLSPNLEDYVIVPVVIMPAGFPNRNGCGFPLSELVKFHVDFGRQSYKTWQGKPTFYEHRHDNPLEANGVILDVFLRKSNSGLYWKVINLMAFDRTKYPELVNRVINKHITTYSMGAYVHGGYTCSVCDKRLGLCSHLPKGKNEIPFRIQPDGTMGFKQALGIEGFETSLVEEPAFIIADTNLILS